ncbi:MAG: rhamnogalacturonan acetylesterase [Bacteroidia bacterium]|nr:rhamnogalacturonan acetylesterase [Bacteroidia bacterium]
MRRISPLWFLLFSLFVSCASAKLITVYTIGDSTMANKKAEVYPETGWGQVFQSYFDTKVRVSNHAVNGRSSKSFIDEGRWKTVFDSLKRGDYVFIQFGHNDEKADKPAVYADASSTYRLNLEKYIVETRAKGATPILLTSIVRRKFDETGKLIDTHGKYPDAVRELASNLKVNIVDMELLTKTLVNSLGDEPSKKLYLWTAPDQKFPEGRKDDTHLCVEGAGTYAGLVATEVAKMKTPLARHVK